MMQIDKPTMPPTTDDARAEAFGQALASEEKRAGRRTGSGLLRALALAWHETTKKGESK